MSSNIISVRQTCYNVISKFLQIPDFEGLKHKIDLINPTFESEDISFSHMQRARRKKKIKKSHLQLEAMASKVRMVVTFWQRGEVI